MELRGGGGIVKEERDLIDRVKAFIEQHDRTAFITPTDVFARLNKHYGYKFIFHKGEEFSDKPKLDEEGVNTYDFEPDETTHRRYYVFPSIFKEHIIKDMPKKMGIRDTREVWYIDKRKESLWNPKNNKQRDSKVY